MDRPLACALAAVLAAGAVGAQEPDAAVSLHRAWLAEVMDLDVRRAVEGYRSVALDARPGQMERWVAVARLVELQRLGALGGAPLPVWTDAPAALRFPRRMS